MISNYQSSGSQSVDNHHILFRQALNTLPAQSQHTNELSVSILYRALQNSRPLKSCSETRPWTRLIHRQVTVQKRLKKNPSWLYAEYEDALATSRTLAQNSDLLREDDAPASSSTKCPEVEESMSQSAATALIQPALSDLDCLEVGEEQKTVPVPDASLSTPVLSQDTTSSAGRK